MLKFIKHITLFFTLVFTLPMGYRFVHIFQHIDITLAEKNHCNYKKNCCDLPAANRIGYSEIKENSRHCEVCEFKFTNFTSNKTLYSEDLPQRITSGPINLTNLCFGLFFGSNRLLRAPPISA